MSFFDHILNAIKEKLNVSEILLESPKDKNFGDFATNIAMQRAKAEHKNPRDIASEILQKIKELSFIESAEIAGAGFINIKIKNDFIIKSVINDEVKKLNQSNYIALDYGAYNIAKDLHIGHLRTSIVGDTFNRIAKFLGIGTVSYNHLGDWGRPMAMIIGWIIKLFPNDWNKDDFKINEKELNTYYPAASAFAKDNPEFLETVQKIKKDFQDGNPEYTALYKKFYDVSMKQMFDVIHRLNIMEFNHNKGEANASKYLKDAEDILNKKQLLHESNGAMVVDVAKDTDTEPMPPFMFYDSRGADTYDSTDLAAIVYRVKNDDPIKMIYFTDSRQRLHFEQLFRVADMAGIFPRSNLEHVYFGTITGTDGKPFKTRDGNVATLSDIMNIVEEAAFEKNKNLPIDTTKMIALAALKFNDLMHDVKSDYIFDPNAVVSFEGRTGPYILYTAVRLNSVLKKAEERVQNATVISLNQEEERDLLLKVLEFPKMIMSAFEKRAPDILANYTYDLCQLANRFYHNCPIKDDINRLAITKKTLNTLSTCIDLMGLKVPEEM